MTPKAGHTFTAGPLRLIVSRPTNFTEILECGHTICRPLGLGEMAMYPSKVKRRRCYECAAIAKATAGGAV